MPNIHRSRKQREQDDLAAARKLKPKLRKYLETEQTRTAAKAHTEQLKKADKLLADIQATKRVARLAMIAFLDKKLWKLWPPAVEMSWTKWDLRDATDAAELRTDLAGFSSFLLREYDTFKAHRDDKAGYPNPMDEKELPFFWQKFCADLRMLIEAGARRVALGPRLFSREDALGRPHPGIVPIYFWPGRSHLLMRRHIAATTLPGAQGRFQRRSV